MNINPELFSKIIKGLEQANLPTRPLPESLKMREVEHYAVEFCGKALIDYYKSKEHPCKTPKMLLKAICEAGIYARCIAEKNLSNSEERAANILSFLMDYDVWGKSGGWSERQSEIIEKTISEVLFLTYQKIKTFDEDTSLRTIMTVLYAVFIFSFSLGI